MRTIFYLLQKEFRQVFRDRAMLFIIFAVPIVQTIILGFAMTVDVKNLRLVVYDADRSALSRELVRRFTKNGYFTLVDAVDSPEGIRDRLDRWQAQVGLAIPPHFERDVYRGFRPRLQLAVDGLDGNTASIALGYAQAIMQEFVAGLHLVAATGSAPVVRSEARFWYNLTLTSNNYMIPGLIGVLLTLVTMFLTSMGLVREKEIGTLEQLMVTPLRPVQLIAGKVLPFLLIGLVELHVMLGTAFLVFDLKLAGSYLLLITVSVLYFLTTLGLGIFISTLAETQQQAMFISWFFMIFIILMSGFLTPIANMPSFWQGVTYANPARYFVNLLREIFLKATPLASLWGEILPLGVFGVMILLASALTFKKRIT